MHLPINENEFKANKFKLLIFFFFFSFQYSEQILPFFFWFLYTRQLSAESGWVYFPSSEESTAGFASSNIKQNATKAQFWQVPTFSDTRRCSRSQACKWWQIWYRWSPLLLFFHCHLGYVGEVIEETNPCVTHLLQRQHWERPRRRLQSLTTGWDGDILGAQTGCTPHRKGHTGLDLHWEQNQGPAEANPGLQYLSCTSLCFLASPGRLSALQKCVKKDSIIPYLSKPETGNTRKACLVQFPVQLCRLKKCR